jgi:glucan 1,3-beta-glucosidase
VNLGGWFVLEPWITPSIFEAAPSGVVDEYTYTQALGSAEAESRLSSHWNTWITQDDFNQIAKAGLNHVRIPIGYWAVQPQSGDPYVQGQLAVLDKAVGWAKSAGLKILLDLHGAPGSQNGFDNSGRLGSIDWQSGGNVDQTLGAVRQLAKRYAPHSDVVTSIELLNEPLGPNLDMDSVKNFYTAGLSTVREYTKNNMITIHDAFQQLPYWEGFMSGAGSDFVALDTHQYQIFSDDQVARSPSDHISFACGLGASVAATDKCKCPTLSTCLPGVHCSTNRFEIQGQLLANGQARKPTAQNG